MSFKIRALVTLSVASVLAATTGILPASASSTPAAGGASASTTTVQVSGQAQPSPDGNQVLLAKGDGWSLYTDAAGAKKAKVTKTLPAGSVSPMYTANCGIITCSLYLSRSETRTANYDIALYGGGIAGLAAACGLLTLITGPAGVVVGVACGVGIAVDGAFLLNAITHAAADNGCLRVRWGVLPTAFYDDHSSYCHDN